MFPEAVPDAMAIVGANGEFRFDPACSRRRSTCWRDVQP